MSSIIYSTRCFIRECMYYLRICIDDQFDRVSTIDDLLLKINNDEELTSNVANILNSFQLQLELSTDENVKTIHENIDVIPQMISLNKLLRIKQIEEAQSINLELSYVDVSEVHLWSVKCIELQMNVDVADQFSRILTECLLKLKHRPRHLLVFLNPECGKNQARSIYEKTISRLFKEANIDVETIYTERANHAHDYILEQSLDTYDGLVCVGGDGMFSELCHSLLLKTTRQFGVNIDDPNVCLKRTHLRIGVIPTGSTDAVAFGTTGHNDPITSALQIILGESIFIDIATVHDERGFVRFLATMLAYGFFGNIIEQSDRWRIFGPFRYTLAGIFQFIENTSYPVELTITQALEKSNSNPMNDDQHQHRNSSEQFIKRREISDKNFKISENKTFTDEIKRQGRYRTVNCLNMPGRCDKSRYGMSPSVHLGHGSFDVILVKRSWYFNFFRFLHRVAEDGQTIEELSNVERFRATEVFIHPMITQENDQGHWACDGEVIQMNQARIRAHREILNLFASGIHLDQIKTINSISSRKKQQWIYWFIPLILLLFVVYYYYSRVYFFY